MTRSDFEFVIVGAGFAGSLAAAVLASEGRSVLLIESGRHPRFAIGESSTPLADFKLESIARRYGLTELLSLVNYGHWMRSHPTVMRGVKRGFSYFYHTQEQPFVTDEIYSNELLVTANSDRSTADTHWLRADVDSLFVDVAVRQGATYLDETRLVAGKCSQSFNLTVSRHGEIHEIQAGFLIVASGNGNLWQSTLPIPVTSFLPRTNTRAVFAHFADVDLWQDVLREAGFHRQAYPFPCDDAALHHVFDGGWMWQLRFDDQTVSAGFTIDNHRHPIGASDSPAMEWNHWLQRFPSIADQFRKSRIVRPEDGLRRVGRLQQPLKQVAGPSWALLPAAVGFADPLFSTGISHALFAVDRLTRLLLQSPQSHDRQQELRRYGEAIEHEVKLVDRLVSLAYRASVKFSGYVTATMPYFAAATSSEQVARTHFDACTSFLLADDPQFLAALSEIEEAFIDCGAETTHFDTNAWESAVRTLLVPFNQVGLLGEPAKRLYHYTAAK